MTDAPRASAPAFANAPAGDPFRAAVALEAWADALDLADLSAARALRAAALLSDPAVAAALPKIPETDRRGLAALHRLALPPAAVTDLGGFGTAFAWAEAALPLLPAAGAVLIVAAGDLNPLDLAAGASPPGSLAACVWRRPEGWLAGSLDISDGAPRGVTREPLGQEREVWATLWRLAGGRWRELVFHSLPEGAEPLVARLEAQRAALIEANALTFH